MIERMVLCGASGDLTSRLLLPAVAQLAEAEMLPPGLTIVGSDVTDWSTDDFREHIAGKLQEHATVPPAARDSVVGALRRIVDPVMAAWAAGEVPLQEYVAGAAPPAPAP